MSMNQLSPDALSKLLSAAGAGGGLEGIIPAAAAANPQVAMAMQIAQQMGDALNDIIARLARIEHVQQIALGRVAILNDGNAQFEAGYLCNGVQAISALLEDEDEPTAEPDKASAGGGN